MQKFKMAEYKRKRLRELAEEIQQLGRDLERISNDLEQTFEMKAEVDSLEFSYIKRVAKLFDMFGCEVKDVNLNPYGANLPGINVN